jgi:tetratricopeptide (TPR) repeat protein
MRYLIRDAKSEAELRARVADDPNVADGVRACAAQLAGPMWRAELQHRVEAALKTAREHEQNQERDKAVEEYCQAIQLDSACAEAYFGRAGNQYDRGDYAEAIADYGEALRLDPNNVLAFTDRGNAWFAKGDLDKALSDYGEAIRLDPSNVPVLVSRANVRRWKQDFKNAIADYEEAIRLDPMNRDAYVGRGTAYSATGEYDRALADFDRAIDLEPKSTAALSARAWIRATCRDQKYRDGSRPSKMLRRRASSPTGSPSNSLKRSRRRMLSRANSTRPSNGKKKQSSWHPMPRKRRLDPGSNSIEKANGTAMSPKTEESHDGSLHDAAQQRPSSIPGRLSTKAGRRPAPIYGSFRPAHR